MVRWLCKISKLEHMYNFFLNVDVLLFSKTQSLRHFSQNIHDMKNDLDIHILICKKQIQIMKLNMLKLDKKLKMHVMTINDNEGRDIKPHTKTLYVINDRCASEEKIGLPATPSQKKNQ